MIDNNIYDLELNKGISIGDNLFILRVPSGWIYEIKGEDNNLHYIFVPFDNKFQDTLNTSNK